MSWKKYWPLSLAKPLTCLIGLTLMHCLEATRNIDLDKCNKPLGMESKLIPDKDISASSSYDSSSVGPQRARLKQHKMGGAWCPRRLVSTDVNEYLEIALQNITAVTGCQTQGRYGHGQGREFAEHYRVQYWRPGLKEWRWWKDRTGEMLLNGNNNTNDVVEEILDPFIVVTKVRIYPYSKYARTVCLRLELLGCTWESDLVAYSMYQGLIQAYTDLRDITYDGMNDSYYLSSGLGQLTDGIRGNDDFSSGSDVFPGSEWVGWSQNSPVLISRIVEILFEFARPRNFSAITLHTNNMFIKDVQVFSHVKVHFGFGGLVFNGEPVHFSSIKDNVLRSARNVIVKLHHRVGRYLRLQLYFSASWIMISEIEFDSVVAEGVFLDESMNTPIESYFESPVVSTKISLHESETESSNNDFNTDEVTGTSDWQRRPLKNTPHFDMDNNFFDENKNEVELDDGETKKQPRTGRQLVGFFIGILSVIIIFLIVAIMFLMLRDRNMRFVCHNRSNSLASTNVEMKESYYGPLGATVVVASNGKVDPNSISTANAYNAVEGYRSLNSSIFFERRQGEDIQMGSLLGNGQSTYPQFESDLMDRPPVPPPPPGQYYSSASLDSCSLAKRVSSIRKRNMTRSLNCIDEPTLRDEEVTELNVFLPTAVPRVPDKLKILDTIAEGQYSDVILCKLDGSVVVLKLFAPEATPCVLRRSRNLAQMQNPNLLRVLGAQFDDASFKAILMEYLPCGDLNQFLQDKAAESNVEKCLNFGCLIYFATQIAAAMEYLESVNFVHRDLATRNCMVGPNHIVKVGDLGTGRSLYPTDYYVMADCSGQNISMPVRWMAWESIFMGKFTSKSDVWSFAVTMWEILTFAREQPFEEFTDEQVVENLGNFVHDRTQQIILQMPINCRREIFELLIECWQKNSDDRPTFSAIHLFLQRKNLHHMLEAI